MFWILLASTNVYQVWLHWPCFKVTGESEAQNAKSVLFYNHIQCSLKVIWLLNTLKGSCTICLVRHNFGQLNVWLSQKLERCSLFWAPQEYDKYHTVHNGIAHWAFPVYNTFNDLDHISKSQQYHTVSNENVVFLDGKVETS